MVDTNNVTEFPVEDISNEMQFDLDDNSMMEVDLEDMSNTTESARRRMKWSNCAVYKGKKHPAQFLYIHGKCRHIQSFQTILSLYGRNVYKTISQSVMNRCGKGEPIKRGAWLMRARNTHPIYAVFNGKKHHIANPSTFNRCRFNWGKVAVVPQFVVDVYPKGPSIRV